MLKFLLWLTLRALGVAFWLMVGTASVNVWNFDFAFTGVWKERVCYRMGGVAVTMENILRLYFNCAKILQLIVPMSCILCNFVKIFVENLKCFD